MRVTWRVNSRTSSSNEVDEQISAAVAAVESPCGTVDVANSHLSKMSASSGNNG